MLKSLEFMKQVRDLKLLVVGHEPTTLPLISQTLPKGRVYVFVPK